MLQARKSEIVSCFVPADPSMIGPRIARLFLRFPSARIADPVATVSAYASDIAEFPLWAIEAGIMSLLRGHGLANKEFAPSGPTVREAVEREVIKLEKELSDINQVLGAEITKEPTSQERERVKRLFKETLAELEANNGPRRGRMTPKQIADAEHVAACIRDGVPDTRPLAPLSEESRRKFVSTNIGDGAAA